MNGKFQLFAPAQSNVSLGEVLAICTAYSQGAHRPMLIAECFFLVQQNGPSLVKRQISIEKTIGDYVAELDGKPVDEDFMIDIAAGEARSILADKLAEQYAKTANAAIYSGSQDLVPMPPRYLAVLWFRNQWHAEIAAIAKSTRCEALSVALRVLSPLGAAKIGELE